MSPRQLPDPGPLRFPEYIFKLLQRPASIPNLILLLRLMQKLKRGPPYDDDPGCKYIVIEDPWPGNAIGKARDERYFNLLCAWVRFMLGKAHEVECVYVVNTVCPVCDFGVVNE